MGLHYSTISRIVKKVEQSGRMPKDKLWPARRKLQ